MYCNYYLIIFQTTAIVLGSYETYRSRQIVTCMEKGISQVGALTPAMNGRAPSARSKPQPRRRASEGISDSSAEGGGGDSFQEPGGTDLDFIGWDHGVRESTSRIRGPVHRSSAERAAFAAGTTGMARRTALATRADKTSDIDMWKGGEDGTDTDVGPGSAGFGMGLGVGVRTSPTKGAEGDVSRKKYLLESELNSADSTPRALADARSRERWRRADEKDARAEHYRLLFVVLGRIAISGYPPTAVDVGTRNPSRYLDKTVVCKLTIKDSIKSS